MLEVFLELKSDETSVQDTTSVYYKAAKVSLW